MWPPSASRVCHRRWTLFELPAWETHAFVLANLHGPLLVIGKTHFRLSSAHGLHRTDDRLIDVPLHEAIDEVRVAAAFAPLPLWQGVDNVGIDLSAVLGMTGCLRRSAYHRADDYQTNLQRPRPLRLYSTKSDEMPPNVPPAIKRCSASRKSAHNIAIIIANDSETVARTIRAATSAGAQSDRSQKVIAVSCGRLRHGKRRS